MYTRLTALASRTAIVVLFVFSICLSVPALSAIIYVRSTGDDSNDGSSWTLAKKTVQYGLNAAGSGGEVWVALGTYPECITLVNGVALYGGFPADGGAWETRNVIGSPTILDGGESGSVVTVPSAATAATIIDGFTIRNGQADEGGGIYCVSSSPTISNNKITANVATWGGGIRTYNCSATIVNNIIVNNSAATEGGGIYSGGYCYSLIGNNTIVGNTAGSNGGGVYVSTPNYASISNCIVAFNSSGVYRQSPGTPVLRNNCVYGNTSYNYSSGLSPGAGDISLDPTFVDRAGGDYHLQVSSPCIDAGYDSVVQPGWVDMDGDPRIYGSHVDIGADESDGVGRTASPIFSPGGGTYYSVQNVAIACATPDAVIHYTTNGVDPTESDPIVTGTVLVDRHMTLKARAWKGSFDPSAVGSAQYIIVLSQVSNAKKLPANSPDVDIRQAVVTAVPTTNQFYIEADDRSCGIKVMKSAHGLMAGTKVDITGTSAVGSTGEKHINATSITDRGTGSIEPLMLVNRDVGGADWRYNAANGAGQKGVKEGSALNNIGMLITTTGNVTYSTTGYFYVDDGSKLADNSGRVGIKVQGMVPPPPSPPPGWTPIGHYVTVTGISMCFKAASPSTDLYRHIWATQVVLVQ